MVLKLFFREFLRDWRAVGSVMPSSPFLYEEMLAGLNLKRTTHVIELGPGTGGLTRRLLKRLPAKAKLSVFEINETFCQKLALIQDPRLSIIAAPAETLANNLAEQSIDYVWSGLPLANFRPATRQLLLQKIGQILTPDGAFVQFQYSRRCEKDLAKHFTDIHIDFTPLNVPPAFVYRCAKVKR